MAARVSIAGMAEMEVDPADSEDEFYDEDAGDYLAAYGNSDGYYMQDEDGFYFDAQDSERTTASGTNDFPPPISKWGEDVGVSEPLEITFDEAKKVAWEQCQKEVNFVRGNFEGSGAAAVDEAVTYLFGEGSELFARFKTKVSVNYEDYCLFMGTFFFECRFSVTYKKLYEDTKVDTSELMDPDSYLDMWFKLDNWNKKEQYKRRFWEETEEAFNATAKELVMPCSTPQEHEIRVTMDDDKHWYNDTVSQKDKPFDENCNLKAERHVKDNTPGFVADVATETASGFPLYVHYRRPGETEYHSMQAMVKHLFRVGDGHRLPNLSGKMEVAADRGYWRAASLLYLVLLGADILGTIMRCLWYPFSFLSKGKKAPQRATSAAAAAESADRPQIIPIAGPARVFQKTLVHNLGKAGEKVFKMTATAFRNGYSSALAMTLSTKYHQNAIDFVIARDADHRRELLFSWTQQTRTDRVTFFWSKPDCIRYNEEHQLGLESSVFNRRVLEIRQAVAKAIRAREYGDVDELGEGEGGEDGEVCSDENGHIVELVSATFLRRLKKGGEEGQQRYMSAGHQAEEPLIRQAYNVLQSEECEWHRSLGDDGVTATDLSAIYKPGLVVNARRPYLRDSSDGVAITKTYDKEDPDNQDATMLNRVPVEVKSRQTARTFHRERTRVQLMKQLGGRNTAVANFAEVNGVMTAELNVLREKATEDGGTKLVAAKGLHRLVPDAHELFQCLHHAVTFRALFGYLLIGSDVQLMAAYCLVFDERLMKAYLNIIDYIYKESLEWVYAPGEHLPEPPQSWLNALKHKKLSWLKMGEPEFKYHCNLWRSLNVDPDPDSGSDSDSSGSSGRPSRTFLNPFITFPLPFIARAIPLVTALWNNLKGGGDTITKLLDNCQARVGLRTAVVGATARLFLYYAVLFHRIHQWCRAKEDVQFYPSLAHARHANNERAAFWDSLKYLGDWFAREARQAGFDNPVEGLDGNDGRTLEMERLFLPESVAEDGGNSGNQRTSRSGGSTPAPVQMPAPSLKTGNTPKIRGTENEAFKLRCELCIGLYVGKVVQIGSTAADPRVKAQCFNCKTVTEYRCFGCRRWLCFKPPKPEKGTKSPKYFAVETPVLEDTVVKAMDDGAGGNQSSLEDVETIRETGQWTCYHAAHQTGWRSFLKLHYPTVVSVASGKRPRRGSYG